MLYANLGLLAQTISQKTGSTEINGGGTGSPMYHLPGNVISATVGLVTCSPNMSFLARLVWDNFGSSEKLKYGTSSSPATPKEQISAGVRVLVSGYLCLRFDFPSSINFRDVSGFPKFGGT